jgi:CAAX prenyl protease-like protein
MIFLGINEGLNSAHLYPWGLDPMYLVYPIQTLVCAGVLAWYWPHYGFRAPRQAWLALAIGVVVFAAWVSPQVLFHLAPRNIGFDPNIFVARPAIYWTELVLRLARTAIVVALLEEIFWRGFLLRYLIKEDFEAVPFGTYSLQSNLIVAVAFMLEHARPDWPGGIIAGLLYNVVAYRCKSLSSCVLAHALTNALLAAFILGTRQWGFW